MELWDAYDENFRLVPGVVLVRGEKPRAGLYHVVVDILVRHRDGTYLLMRRDPRKILGGMWEASAGAPPCGAKRPWRPPRGRRCLPITASAAFAPCSCPAGRGGS